MLAATRQEEKDMSEFRPSGFKGFQGAALFKPSLGLNQIPAKHLAERLCWVRA